MATVEQIARAAMRDLGSDVGLLNAAQWVQERYEELTARRMKHLERRGVITVPAAITKGLATVVKGQRTVKGDGNVLWTDVLGRYFQVRNVWYRILGVSAAHVTSFPVLHLDAPYTEASETNVPYHIVQRFATLPADVQYLSTYATHAKRRRAVFVGLTPELELSVPDRLFTTGGPAYMADAGVDAETGNRIVEIYPYSKEDETITFRYWAVPRKYSLAEQLPAFITANELKEGVLIDMMRWMMSECLRQKDKDGAAHWRNEYRAQETRWMGKALPSLAKRDQAVEDKALTLRAGFLIRRDIRTARDEVYVRGNRP